VWHLNEYVSLDVEMTWIDSEQDLLDLEVRILKHIFVHGFPRKKRPFYTYPVDRRITMGFDCLSMFKYGCPPHCGFAPRVPGCLRLTPRGGPYPLMTSDHLRHRG
jgi:aspartyl/asparaginyl-tRNA synthetase